jgi:hypothetical protein
MQFLGKPVDYWVKLNEDFGDIQDDPATRLIVAEIRLAKLEQSYITEKQQLLDTIYTLKKQLNG